MQSTTSGTVPCQVFRCPLCEGRGNVQAGFYGRMAVATDTAPEPCQACGGTGLLKVSVTGGVEKLT